MKPWLCLSCIFLLSLVSHFMDSWHSFKSGTPRVFPFSFFQPFLSNLWRLAARWRGLKSARRNNWEQRWVPGRAVRSSFCLLVGSGSVSFKGILLKKSFFRRDPGRDQTLPWNNLSFCGYSQLRFQWDRESLNWRGQGLWRENPGDSERELASLCPKGNESPGIFLPSIQSSPTFCCRFCCASREGLLLC